MSYEKDKQAWYDKERRHKLALAIIDKMEKTTEGDWNVIPALNRYVETGDETMFEEFMQFHSIKDLEQKAKHLDDSIAWVKHQIENKEHELEYNQRRLDEMTRDVANYRSKIQERWDEYKAMVKECDDRRNALRAQLAEITPIIEAPTMKDLSSFIERVTKEVPQGKARKLWLKEGDKVKPVKCFIILGDNKAVFEVDSNDLVTP